MPPARRSSNSRRPKKETPQSNVPMMAAIGGGAVIVILVVVLAFQMGRTSTPAVPVATNNAAQPAVAPAAPQQATPAPAHAPPAAPAVNQGPPSVADKFVYESMFSGDKSTIGATTAFAVRHPDFSTPIVLSCLNVFPADVVPKDLPSIVKKVSLTDRFTGVNLGEVEGAIIAIPESAPVERTSSAGDIVAMWGVTSTRLTTANLATKGPAEGEPVWVATRVASNGSKVHKATVSRVEPALLVYKFDDVNIDLKETGGSPLLNANGDVVGVHLGESRSGPGTGNANPVGVFLPHLLTACKATPVPSKTVATTTTPGRDLSGTELVEFVEPSVVVIRVKGQYGDSLGSGFVVDKSGMIITNYHVVEGAKSAVALFRTKEEFPIKGWWALDPASDLALLQIDCPAEKLHPVKLAKDLPKKGEAVAAFGAPHGLDFSYTKGDVSALRTGDDFKKKGQFIQTSAAISSGNSGGPLTNMRGEVVGVNSFKVASGENLNFAVSSVDVASIISKKNGQLGAISPKDIPDRSGGGRMGAEDLTGTERGNVLLGRIREALIIIEGITYDPTGRLETFVLRNCESAIDKQLKWKRVSRRDEPSASTAFMVILVYFDFDETKRDLVTEIHILMQVIARDVDEGRRPIIALVYKEDVTVGTVSINALVNGIIPRTLETSVPKAFNKLASTYKKAAREAEGKAATPKSDKTEKPEKTEKTEK